MSNALLHPCPVCDQPPGQPCITQLTGAVMPKPHYNRIPSLEVRCPACGAEVGVECTRIGPHSLLSHWARITKVEGASTRRVDTVDLDV